MTQFDFAAKFGLLYAWDEAQFACPDGWRLPTDKEWDYLISFVEPGSTDNNNTAGKYLRANNNWFNSRDRTPASQGLRWGQPNEDGTSLVGFNALPSGYVYSGGKLTYNFSTIGFWWIGGRRGSMILYYDKSILLANDDAIGDYRLSARCVIDLIYLSEKYFNLPSVLV